jgi:hypothetical protein
MMLEKQTDCPRGRQGLAGIFCVRGYPEGWVLRGWSMLLTLQDVGSARPDNSAKIEILFDQPESAAK